MKRVVQLSPFPARPKSGHKGLFGRVLVVGGSETMIGAPALSGTAALRSGAGLVQIAMPIAALPFAISMTPELIGVDVAAAKELQKAIAAADAIVLGPGLGQGANARRLVEKLAALDTPRVIDADALNILSCEKSWKFKLPGAVLTPHPGEMKRLAKSMKLNGDSATGDDSARIALAASAAKKSAAVIVLKGHRTVVTDGERVYVNRTGDSTLSKAGSGDVLCGVLAVLLAQKVSPFEASCTAVWIHGRAGELAGRRLGSRFALALDVIDELEDATREYESDFGING